MEEGMKNNVVVRFVWTGDVKVYDPSVKVIRPSDGFVMTCVPDVRKLPKLGMEANELVHGVIFAMRAVMDGNVMDQQVEKENLVPVPLAAFIKPKKDEPLTSHDENQKPAISVTVSIMPPAKQPDTMPAAARSGNLIIQDLDF